MKFRDGEGGRIIVKDHASRSAADIEWNVANCRIVYVLRGQMCSI